MKRHSIVFTGGGTAGHVTPNIAIINELKKTTKFDIHYIGSKNGIERNLIGDIGVPYHAISSGKLRRYVDFENVKDVFRVAKGTVDSWSILRKLKPRLVFSKGGFVSVPVLLAAKTLKIPSLIHESDLTPGLANRIAQRFATKIFTSFEEAVNYFPKDKTIATGSPIRTEILNSDNNNSFSIFGSNSDASLPTVTIMGGSLGAKSINQAVRTTLPNLVKKFKIIHICGKGNLDPHFNNFENYAQFEFLNEELPYVLSISDMVITRGGSNAIFEFLSLQIPMLIIPLPKSQSRGDQILNAKNFAEKGYALVLEEENLTPLSFLNNVRELALKRDDLRANMNRTPKKNGLTAIVQEIITSIP